MNIALSRCSLNVKSHYDLVVFSLALRSPGNSVRLSGAVEEGKGKGADQGQFCPQSEQLSLYWFDIGFGLRSRLNNSFLS